MKVIAQTHDAWKKLIKKSIPAKDLSLVGVVQILEFCANPNLTLIKL